MSAATRRRAGRPTTAPRPGEKATLGIRASAELKERLDREAKLNDRSLSEEAARRLEQSFDKQQAISEALDFKFGARAAGAIQLIAKIIEFSAHEAFLLSSRGVADWLGDPYVFDQVARGIGRALETLRPDGDPAAPVLGDKNRDDWQGIDLSPIARRIGERASATILDAAIDPVNAARGLGSWAKPIAEKLGDDLVNRIRTREREGT